MVSWLNACEYCTNCHEDLAQRLGIDQATLDDLGNYAHSDHFSFPERAALAAAVSLTREPRALPPTIREQLENHFDEGEIVEIIAAIGLYNYINRLSNALELGALIEI
jgi:alkylhydroperoxidase family enzyme